jgi:hypothetical protein
MEIRRCALAAATAIVIVLGAAPSASAGGAMFDLPKDFYVPGQQVRAQSTVSLKVPSRGELDDGPYFAHVARVVGGARPSIPEDSIVTVPIRIEPRGGRRFGTATIEFTVPDAPPGLYVISSCDESCTTWLGDLVSSYFSIATDRSEARLLAITNRLEERLRELRHRIVNRVLGNRHVTLATRVQSLEESLAALEEEVAASDRTPLAPAGTERSSSSLGPLLAFVLPAAILGAVFGRRTRQPK